MTYRVIWGSGSRWFTARTMIFRPTTASCSSTASTRARPLCGVAKDLGYSIVDTIAIGDSDNDAAMLKAAGTSVAMGNATHGIECFCDMTTTDIHDDGIANAFVTLGLI